jgi:hypothetical protein
LPKKIRSEKQKANDEKLRQTQKNKKVLSDANKELVKMAEQKLFSETKNIKIKILPKIKRVRKVADYVEAVLKNKEETPVEPESESSSDDEIKSLGSTSLLAVFLFLLNAPFLEGTSIGKQLACLRRRLLLVPPH